MVTFTLCGKKRRINAKLERCLKVGWILLNALYWTGFGLVVYFLLLLLLC